MSPLSNNFACAPDQPIAFAECRLNMARYTKLIYKHTSGIFVVVKQER